MILRKLYHKNNANVYNIFVFTKNCLSGFFLNTVCGTFTALYALLYACKLFFAKFLKKKIQIFFEIIYPMLTFAVVNIKRIIMNKVKGVLIVALVLAISAPCVGSSVAIKRKKNKWQHSIEQKTSENTDIKSVYGSAF